MIITRTPLRMSYVGGGSDLPSYYREFGGAVISTAINKYVYVLVKPRFEKGVRLSYSIVENVERACYLKHPIVRNALDILQINDNIEIVSMADIPSSGTGLGSSSSFTVGLLNALLAYKGQKRSTGEIAELACKLEIELCASPIGKQDQYAAAFGGLKTYKFNRDDTVTIESVALSSDMVNKLNRETIVFYIGGERSANTILKEQSLALESNEKSNSMAKMTGLVWALKKELESGSTDNFGKIMHENWELKRKLTSAISNQYIDNIYSQAMKSGATGGKLLGAGGGGFMIFHVPNESTRSQVKKRLSQLRHVDFRLEDSGSSIIFYQ